MITNKNCDLKILVVDDISELLDISIRSLKKVYYNVFSAVNGAECIEVLHRERPDIILLDIMLPDANGQDLAMKIKNDPEFSSVYIILLSSLKTSTHDISDGLEKGADGYIVRPVNSRELLARVAAAGRIISAEREYKASLFKYYSLFSSMQEGVYLHEMIYDELGKAVNYRIIEANPASEKHLSIKTENAIGKYATELYGISEAPLLELYAKVTETGKAISFEQYFPPMGKYFQISAFSPGEGKFATIFTDITERKRAEEEINHKNIELQKLNAEKDKFFSIIAHDLRSQFNGFLGLTQIMDEELPTLTMAEIQNIATGLRESANNLFLLLENLLEWAKIQQGLIPFEPKTIKFLSIINECMSTMLEISKNKGIELTYNFPDNISVFADRYILQTIIRNLVSNALKFTPRGGKVSLSAKNSANECVEISICDNGIGMSHKMVENLFQLEVQTNRKGTENEPSSGLGLMLCKEFIERHGGNLRIESEDGKGSIFYFTIPNSTNL